MRLQRVKLLDRLEKIRHLALQALTFGGLPLAGWWLGGRLVVDSATPQQALFSEPARVGYFIAAAAQLLAAAILTIRHPLLKERFNLRSGLVYLQKLFIETGLVLGPFSDHRGQLPLGGDSDLRWTGVVLFVLAEALLLWCDVVYTRAIAHQGLNRDDLILVEEGPYRLMRHPSHLAALFSALGIALVFQSAIGLGLCAFLSLLLIQRVNTLEKSMQARFGEEWIAYQARTWRLLPPLY